VAEEKRKNRWLVNTVLVGATVALMGVTAAPLISMMGIGGPAPDANNQSSPDASAQASASPSPNAQNRQEELKKLAEGYALVLQREPNDPRALRGLLETRLALSDIKGAIEPLQKLVELTPQDTQLAVLLAQAKQQTNDPEAAAQVYRGILQKQPGELDALGGLSALLISQQKPEAAMSLLKDTLKEAPKTNQTTPGSVDTAAVQVLLGKVLASQKRFDEAIASFDAAAKDNPQNFQPIFYKASVLKEQGKADEAKTLFNKALAMAPVEFKDQINREINPASAPSNASPAGDMASPVDLGAPKEGGAKPEEKSTEVPKAPLEQAEPTNKP
jgi:tetratricopeptide (TPR) repeat protein